MSRILPFICAYALVIQPILGYNKSLYDSGSTLYLEITFHELDRLSFVDQRDIMLGNIQKATIGAQDPIGYRDMETSPNTAGPLGYQARLLFEFAKRDYTPASLLASTLKNSPDVVFPPSEFGSYNLTYADMINCVSQCGIHGMRVPLISQNDRTAVGCTCQCDPGWSTDITQPFESYVYCAMEDPNSDASLTPNQNLGGDWRPPVPLYPPPPPKTYEDQSSKKLPLFKWAIIGASIIVFAMLVFIMCKTRCCGLTRLLSSCCCCCGSSDPFHQTYVQRPPKGYPPQLPYAVNPHVYTFTTPYQYPPQNTYQQTMTTSPLANGHMQASSSRPQSSQYQ